MYGLGWNEKGVLLMEVENVLLMNVNVNDVDGELIVC